MAPKKNKRERDRFHFKNPSIGDCLWYYKTIAAANAVHCLKCNQPNYNRCSVQCGTTEAGVFKKCCDTFATNVPQEEYSNEKENETSNDSFSDDGQDKDLDKLVKDSNASEAISENDLVIFAKSIKKSFRSSVKKSSVSLGSKIKSFNAANAAVKANNYLNCGLSFFRILTR